MRTYQPGPRDPAPAVTWQQRLLPADDRRLYGERCQQAGSFGGPGGARGYSERTQWRIDREVATLLTRAEARARELLTERMQALHQLTTALVERETITGDQVRALVRAASPPSASADRPDLGIAPLAASPASTGTVQAFPSGGNDAGY